MPYTTLPNPFGDVQPLTESELAELKLLMQHPVLRKSIYNTYTTEYAAFLSRQPLEMSTREMRDGHSYLAGMHALGQSLLNLQLSD